MNVKKNAEAGKETRAGCSVRGKGGRGGGTGSGTRLQRQSVSKDAINTEIAREVVLDIFPNPISPSISSSCE